ncbi:molybdopterin-binding protein [Breznakiella homolactica]|uniref:MoaB/Mog domain-containing protein n=1 Tax=Breznakiella homolactica TaxID=2798577 RepID=A0A7T8BAP2_9SPIR|nr:molybdopterin-binding protein [Breznakiella homolactica]QQO10939.1 hypothetical protein JFL75_08485 [Breznakiella homolactica]
MGLNLLEKTELWVNNITLDNANLTVLAHTAADVLSLPRDKVLVVDVRPEHITLDILAKDIPVENITGKEKDLLEALGAIPGVNLTEETYIHSNGILGLLCMEGQDGAELSRKVDGMVDDIRSRIAKRAIIFPTGFELKQNLIEDTNTPFLRELLESNGYTAATGPIIQDDVYDVEGKLSEALSKAYGLIITTGGVGAEDKDKTVEGILRLDPEAATPYIVKFQQGTGRHVKDGVRIAVGSVGPSWMVAFPGPNDEVRAGAEVLLDCLRRGYDKESTARAIAGTLAKILQEKQMEFHHHHHNTKHEQED